MAGIYAPRLDRGDEIRVIAPSRSLSVVRDDIFDSAAEYLRSCGYSVSFGERCREAEYGDSASVSARIADLHDAFCDPKVKAVLSCIGGFNVNQILEYIDYSLIQDNPKIICGYSDNTALLNAIYAKTGLVTYHGPNFSSFGFEDGREYTGEYFRKAVEGCGEYCIAPSPRAGRYEVVREGSCEGVIVGGNLCTLNLLQGTGFMPGTKDVVLFLEDDNIMGEYFTREFDRNLQSLLQVKDCRIVGIVFGRFTDDCGMNADVISRIVREKRQLEDVPIVYNADFGHVFPFFTFPIGGTAKVIAEGDRAEIRICKH